MSDKRKMSDLAALDDYKIEMPQGFNPYVPTLEQSTLGPLSLEAEVLGGVNQPRTKQFYEKPDWGLGLTYRRKF